MNAEITILLIIAAIYLPVCAAIAIKTHAEYKKWVYKGQYIKKRAESLLRSRWLRCYRKPIGVDFCSDCTKHEKCLAECKEEIEKFIDEEGGNDAD